VRAALLLPKLSAHRQNQLSVQLNSNIPMSQILEVKVKQVTVAQRCALFNVADAHRRHRHGQERENTSLAVKTARFQQQSLSAPAECAQTVRSQAQTVSPASLLINWWLQPPRPGAWHRARLSFMR
jgi:hypothetical protein